MLAYQTGKEKLQLKIDSLTHGHKHCQSVGHISSVILFYIIIYIFNVPDFDDGLIPICLLLEKRNLEKLYSICLTQ